MQNIQHGSLTKCDPSRRIDIMLRRDFRSIGTMYEMLGSWSYHRILRATASLAFLLFFAFFRENVTSSVVEVVGRLRFDEPLQGFVRTSVRKHTRAQFVCLQIQLAVVVWQGVEDDEIQIHFLLAVAVLGR